jgi:hypothetical protein
MIISWFYGNSVVAWYQPSSSSLFGHEKNRPTSPGLPSG